jgi:uncharacterized integral membrane protein (TIGR00697 family)
MISNELLFVCHSAFLAGVTIMAAKMGKECLTAIVALFAVLSNAFIIKETNFFGLTATCTDSFAIGATLALNLVHQKYGYQSAQKVVKISSFCLALYMIASQFQLGYSSEVQSSINQAFTIILSTSPRIVIASLFTFYVAQSLDCSIYNWLQNHPKFAFFESKNVISTAISQFIDTVLFSYLALYGIIDNISNIIIISFIIKIFALFISAALIHFSKKCDPSLCGQSEQ